MIVLAIDASTYDGSVAVLRDGAVAAERVVAMRGEHQERLMPAVAQALAGVGMGPADLDAVACGAGPGSFTSLRIAASIAKGIARAREIPLLVAPSLPLIAAGARPPLPGGRYVAVLDAMRRDVFGAELTVSDRGIIVESGDVWRLSRDEAASRAARSKATMIGPAEALARAPHARGFAGLMTAGLVRSVDVSGWEPEYGRKAEAQVRWETAHGRPLDVR